MHTDFFFLLKQDSPCVSKSIIQFLFVPLMVFPLYWKASCRLCIASCAIGSISTLEVAILMELKL